MTLSVYMSVQFPRRNYSTDFNEIFYEDTSVLEQGHKLFLSAISDIQAGGVEGKVSTKISTL